MLVSASLWSCGGGTAGTQRGSQESSAGGPNTSTGDNIAANAAFAVFDKGFGPGRSTSTAPELFDEEDAWDIVEFTDPRDEQVYDIIDGRVIIALVEDPELPEVAANYFIEPLSPTDPYWDDFAAVVPESLTENEDVADFLETEELTVYAEWPEVGGLAVLLPEGQSVEDAVENWPTEYSALIEAVDADVVCPGAVWPASGSPNDEHFSNQWAIDDANYPGSSAETDEFDINIEQAWHDDADSFGSSGIYIAIIDTGVDYNATYLRDLNDNSSALGCNVGDRRAATSFASRSSGGGRPWQWLLDESEDNAHSLGHGTQVAGIASAAINNDGGTANDDRDICGIARYCRYFPIASKARGREDGVPLFSLSANLNALTAVGCVAQRYDPKILYGPSTNCPTYNIRVVNCSWMHGKSGTGPAVGLRHMAKLSPHMLFVCSSGNNDSSTRSWFPANYSANVSVCNYDSDGDRVMGNYDATVDISAPGVSCWSIDMYGSNGNSNYLGKAPGPIAFFEGTSCAAPHVAAVAGIIASLSAEPTASEVKTALLATKAAMSGDLTSIDRVDAGPAIEYWQ